MNKTTALMASVLTISLMGFGCGGGGDAAAPTGGYHAKGSDPKDEHAKGEHPKDSAAKADTPTAAIKGMLALAEAGKWEAYVTSYYGEQHKLTKPEEQIKVIAARVEKVGPKLIEVLKACLDQEPKLSDDGNVAEFPKYKLHKDDGKWGFHM